MYILHYLRNKPCRKPEVLFKSCKAFSLDGLFKGGEGGARPRGPALDIEYIDKIFKFIALICGKVHQKVI